MAKFNYAVFQDMGLGKTVTMIALIFTNYHDQRPLAKKSYGYIRPPIESCKRTGKQRKVLKINSKKYKIFLLI